MTSERKDYYCHCEPEDDQDCSVCLNEQEEFADCFEPARFVWSNDTCAADIAAKEFSKHTNADY